MESYIIGPDISEDKLCFVSEDDLFTSDHDGKNVRRIVSGLGVISDPKFSNNGQNIAFRLMRGIHNGVNEVFVCNRDGGDLKQVTYIGSPATGIAGWIDNENLMVYSDLFAPTRGLTEFYSVNIITTKMEKSNYGYGHRIEFTPKGTLLGRNTVEVSYWKNYRGGTRGKLWYRGNEEKHFRKFLELETNIHSPKLLGEKVYFVTDKDGSANIYSCDLKSKEVGKETDFTEYDVRTMGGFGKRLIFTMAGELYLYEIDKKKSHKINLKIEKQKPKSLFSFSGIKDNLERVQLFDEENIGIISRGRAILKGKFDEVPVSLNQKFLGRIREIGHAGKDRFIVSQEIDGEDGFIIYDRNGERKDEIKLSVGIIMNFKIIPDSGVVIFSNNRHELYKLNIKDQKLKRIDRSPGGRLNDFDISSDSKLVAYSYQMGVDRAQIRIYSMNEEKVYEVSSKSALDFSPSFDSSGLYLNYLTNRALDPTYDSLNFDLGFVSIFRPCCVSLTKGGRNPFINALPEIPKERKDVEYDLENLRMQIQVYPVDSDNYTSLQSGNGKVFYVKNKIEGSLKYYNLGGGGPRKGTLMCYDLSKREERTVADGITSFSLSEDRQKLLLQKGEDYSIVGIDLTPESQKDFKKGKIKLSDMNIRIERESEFKQMFNETWKLMREGYWNSEKLANWDKIREKYAKLIHSIQTRAELSDILKKMQGELGTSHSYEIGGDLTEVKYYPSARLGAITVDTKKGAFIERIFCGDPSNEGEKSPLLDSGLEIREGDRILKIDGVEINLKYGVLQALLNKREDLVSLVIENQKKEVKEYKVKLIGNQRNLIYRDWVEKNRRYVHVKSHGRVGYIHIPDMGPYGFSEFHRLFSEETTYENLIVDVRYNGGGHVSQLILDKLGRKYLGEDISRFGEPQPYPNYSIRGKMICVTNEFAGSDGDIFSHAFKLMKLGELVGTRTWGGVIGINPMTKLIDGTVVTQPEYAFNFIDVGWGVENYGTDPTIEVEITPEEFASGADPQLDRALKEVS